MAENSKIEWTRHTFNPWRGCTKVSAGCAHCYAETMSGRNPAVLGVWGPKGSRIVAAESYWKQPIKWDKAAADAGERHRVFCASLADVFEGPETMPEEAWPVVQQARGRLYQLIEDTPNLDWLLLTKRPQWIHLLTDRWRDGWPTNVWIGTSVEDQAAADERIPHLLRVPARVRFLSCEPLLGPVDLGHYLEHPALHWVIVGGESGPKARPMHPDWARSLRDQCQAAGVHFFFKQWGEWLPFGQRTAHVDTARGMSFEESEYYQDLINRGVKRHEFPHPDRRTMYRVGKHAAGRLLDGIEWNEVPL